MGKSRKKKPFDPLAVFKRVSDIHEFNWIPNTNRQTSNDPLGFFKVYVFKCDCNDPIYDEWESADRLAAKGEYCENPKCESKPPILPIKGPTLSATPCYYTDGAFFGMFQCPTCKTTWQSALAFANKYQGCRMCKTHVWSYDMSDTPIWNYYRSNGETRPPHDQELCQKCKNSDRPCYRGVVKGRGNWDRYYLGKVPVGHQQPPPKKKRNRGGKKKRTGILHPEQGQGGPGTSATAAVAATTTQKDLTAGPTTSRQVPKPIKAAVKVAAVAPTASGEALPVEVESKKKTKKWKGPWQRKNAGSQQPVTANGGADGEFIRVVQEALSKLNV